MRGVRQQRQGVREEPDEHLDGHERDDQGQGDAQPAAVGVAGYAVSMPVRAAVFVVMGHAVRTFPAARSLTGPVVVFIPMLR